VLFPTQTTSASRGIRKYSTVRASANEFGGMMQTSPGSPRVALVEVLRVDDRAVDVREDLDSSAQRTS
jgi:hypothetical protein